MEYGSMALGEFCSRLASKDPAPGGGGASAAAGALGAALIGMVGSLTAGKARYAEAEGGLREIMEEAGALGARLLALVDEDAAAFEPLAKAYAIPKDEPARAQTLEKCLLAAAQPPLETLRAACRCIELHASLADRCSALALSDVGTGAVLCRAAMYGAAMNVRVNTHLMTDTAEKARINAEVDALMQKHWRIAGETYEKVWDRLG